MAFFRDSRDDYEMPLDVLARLPDNFENSWATEWYVTRHRCYEHAAPLDIDTIGSYLFNMNAKILEDILFMGIAIKIRCMIKKFQGDKQRGTLDPGQKLAVDDARQGYDLGLCNSILHHFDSTNQLSAHHKPPHKYPDYDHSAVRSWCTMLISRYIVGGSGDARASMQISRDMGMPTDHRIPLTFNAVLRGFRFFQQQDAHLMEEIFILGCAGVCRGVVTCLLALRNDDFARYNPQSFLEIENHFNRLNLTDFRNKLGADHHLYASPKNELDKYYQMLCGIVHCKDFKSKTQIFHNDRYDTFFPVIRWEVLNLTLAYLVEYKNEPVLHYQLQARLPGIHHMVKGPAHFFSLFPELDKSV